MAARTSALASVYGRSVQILSLERRLVDLRVSV
jgi:hypothetical protein